jgi:hypothetical protein
MLLFSYFFGRKMTESNSPNIWYVGEIMAKVIDGFLYGTGFVLAYIIITKLAALIGLH